MFENQITQSIDAGAPDITYSGNEGPKSPQQEQMMEQQMMSPVDYSSPAFKAKLIDKIMKDEGLDFGAATAQAEWIIRNKLKPRQGAAFGGIMGLDGRKQYGLGSRLRKLIPNEIAKVAEVAAPFVAPFNPLAAGLMSGIGGFDRTGNIGSSIKSGLMNYGLGNVSRMVGGAGFQGGLKAPGVGQGFGSYFTSPTSGQQMFGTKNVVDSNKAAAAIENAKANEIGLFTEGQAGSNLTTNPLDEFKNVANINVADPKSSGNFITRGLDKLNLGKIKEYIPTSLAELGTKKGAIGAIGLASLAGGLMSMNQDDVVDEIMDRGEGLDIAGIRAEVTEAFKDSTGEKLLALRTKYPYLGTQASKNTAIMAQGGRIRRAEGGLMDLGGMEKDYRAEGGFVPIGSKEKADDVPARLSVNEFVFTADAVRNAGSGDIDKGAKIMENMMKHLEQGGQVSEESQGMSGAQQMFETSQRLSEVV